MLYKLKGFLKCLLKELFLDALVRAVPIRQLRLEDITSNRKLFFI